MLEMFEITRIVMGIICLLMSIVMFRHFAPNKVSKIIWLNSIVFSAITVICLIANYVTYKKSGTPTTPTIRTMHFCDEDNKECEFESNIYMIDGEKYIIKTCKYCDRIVEYKFPTNEVLAKLVSDNEYPMLEDETKE